ncbi:MAG: hypothetical protein A2521_09230 [Deltaproteobacteria bacterium RIFOXYD12_FULL_57_12]|nr:MAG: hypothetical protein A2521_09230 [Deltaproteobacteria bacterium RIFOXYD12_FULL_57_12]
MLQWYSSLNSALGPEDKIMNEFDMLKKISSNLTDRKSSAALSNYKVLCNNIAFINKEFYCAIATLRSIHGKITTAL